MRIRVSGKQVQIGQTLPADVRTRLDEAISKHFDGGAEAHVVFSHEGPFYRADCFVHLDSKTTLTAEGVDNDAHRAFDKAFVRLLARLRRYKARHRRHHVKDRQRA